MGFRGHSGKGLPEYVSRSTISVIKVERISYRALRVGVISAKQGGTAGLPVPAEEHIFCRGIFISSTERETKKSPFGVK